MFLKLTNIRIIKTLLITLAVPFVIVSCGGGGGGDPAPAGGGGAVGTAPTTPIAINSANAPSLVNQALSVDTDFGFIGASVTTTPTLPKLSKFSKNLVSHVKNNRQTAVSVVGATVTTDCDNVGAGTVTNTDNSTLANDVYSGSFSVSFNNCLIGTVTTNGSFSFSGSAAVDGSFFKGTFTINNLTTVDSLGNVTVSVNGSMNFDSTQVGTIETSRISGSLFEFKVGNDVLDLSNFDMAYVYNSATNIETADINYTISSTLLNGSFSIDTTQIIKQNLSFLYPFEGQVVFTGANGSKCRVTVNAGGLGNPNDTVTIEVDADGDGTYESSEVLTWAQIAAQ